jgi:hypothetical protein
MDAYTSVLLIHSVLRYALLAFAFIAVYRAFSGWVGNKPYTTTDNKVATFLIATVHSQLLLGLVLYGFLSPYVKMGLADMKAAMKTPLLRFWTVEHISLMIVAVVLFQLGRTLSKKATTDKAKHQRAAIFFTLALVTVFVMIPWPFYEGMAYFGKFNRSYWLSGSLF